MSNKQHDNDLDLPEGWEMSTLGEFVAHRSKGIVPNRTPDETFELYSVPSFDIGMPEIVKGGDIGSNKQIVGEGVVLLCKINPRINRSWIVFSHSPNQKIASTEWITFPPNDAFEPRYLVYYLKQDALRDFLAANASGVGGSLMRVKPATVKGYPLPIAPESQQKRIVAEIEKQFSRLDEAVENLKRVKANLKRYKASVLKAAVEGKLTEEWRAAHPDVEPAEKLLERILAKRRKKWEEVELAKMKDRGKVPKDDKWKKKYKDPNMPNLENLPSIPNTWTWATLPQLGELNRGKSKHRPRNDPILYDGPYPFIQTGDIRHATGSINQYTQTYSEEGLEQSRLWPKGTLCITIAANIADTALLGFDACFPDSVVGFIPDSDYIDIRLVEYFIRTAKEDLERYAPATAQKNINLAILSNVAVPLPPEKEQQKIIDEIEKSLSVAEGIEVSAEQNVLRAERLRQSILKKAFSGKLVQQNSSDKS